MVILDSEDNHMYVKEVAPSFTQAKVVNPNS